MKNLKTMETSRMKLGRMGEDAACGFLLKNGHTILERNWRGGHLEIDIISMDKAGIHFVEVKSRVAPVSAAPEENVGYTKQRRLAAAAQKYLHSKEKGSLFGSFEIYFDVISVIFEGEKIDLQYYPQAYVPIYA